MGFHEPEGQSLDSYQFHGVVPAELDQKLSHLLIEQQEHQIVELESELNLAQSKLQSKEAELQALKECVRRLTDFSLSTVSGRTFKLNPLKPVMWKKSCGFVYWLFRSWHFFLEDETGAHEEQLETDEQDYKNKTESDSKKLMVGMKRPMDSESCAHYVRWCCIFCG